MEARYSLCKRNFSKNHEINVKSVVMAQNVLHTASNPAFS